MREIFFIILLASIICFSSPETFAQCSCEPKKNFQSSFQRSDVVFIGKVIESNKVEGENIGGSSVFAIRFEVKQTWKQDLEKFVTVKMYGDAKSFELNSEMLLYTQKDNDGNLQAGITCCSRTRLLSVAEENGDLKALKKWQKAKKVIEK